MKKRLLITIFLLALFVLAVAIWYSPNLFKGYSAQPISQDILLARNYSQTGVLATHNNQSIVISSSLLKEQGHSLLMSQYLRSFFYAKIFDIVGVPNYNNLILISIILYALVLLLFVILILYLFNLKVAVIFSLIYIFSPIGWGLSRILGGYEFCLFFFALFFIFYFIGIHPHHQKFGVGVKKTKQSQSKFNSLFFIISGIFLSLSALSREAALVFALAFFIFLLIKKLKQQLIYIFVPFVLLLIIFWLPSFLSGENIYLSLLTNQPTNKADSLAQLHVFPDPYTYYFEKEEFLEGFRNQDLGLSENLETRKILSNFGFEQINLFSRIKVGFYLLFQHISRFFSLEEFGGPFFALLLILGLIYLRNKYKFLYQISLYWIVISLFVFAFIVLVSRNHLMDFIWLLMLLITLGLFYLIYIIKDYFKLRGKKAMLFNVIIIGLVLYHLILVNHVLLGKIYDDDSMPRSMAYAQEIKEFNIIDTDVIAIPEDFPGQGITLNYLIDKSFVIFKESTLEKLLKEGKTKKALEAFGVKYILGYSDELSKKIISQAEVINIASQSLEIDIGEISETKSFLMNLIR